MPELPEVEVTRLKLEPLLPGLGRAVLVEKFYHRPVIPLTVALMSGIALGSMLMNTNPPQVPTATSGTYVTTTPAPRLRARVRLMNRTYGRVVAYSP